MTKQLTINLNDAALDKIDRIRSSAPIVIDTETTGFTNSCQVIELSLVDGLTAEVLFNSLYRPTTSISYGAKKVHGIAFADVLSAPNFGAHTFHEWFDLIEDMLLVGWNFAFDRRLVRQTLLAHDARHEADLWEEHCDYYSADLMDIVKDLTGVGRISQERALKLFGVEMVHTNTHRATADCLNLQALMQKLFALADGEL